MECWRQCAAPVAHDRVGVIGRDEKCDFKWEKLPRRVRISIFLRMEVFLVTKNIIKCYRASGALTFFCPSVLGAHKDKITWANAVIKQKFESLWIIRTKSLSNSLCDLEGNCGGIGKDWIMLECLTGRDWLTSIWLKVKDLGKKHADTRWQRIT